MMRKLCPKCKFVAWRFKIVFLKSFLEWLRYCWHYSKPEFSSSGWLLSDWEATRASVPGSWITAGIEGQWAQSYNVCLGLKQRKGPLNSKKSLCSVPTQIVSRITGASEHKNVRKIRQVRPTKASMASDIFAKNTYAWSKTTLEKEIKPSWQKRSSQTGQQCTICSASAFVATAIRDCRQRAPPTTMSGGEGKVGTSGRSCLSPSTSNFHALLQKSSRPQKNCMN